MPDRTPDTCVFCAILEGIEPAEVVRSWPEAIAIVPLNPVTDGHTLVIPAAHVPDAAAHPEVTANTMRRAAQFAAEWESSNILTSIGAPATQSVWHLHAHIVPRRPGDGLMLPWGTTGDPHAPHWCETAETLSRALAATRGVPGGR